MPLTARGTRRFASSFAAYIAVIAISSSVFGQTETDRSETSREIQWKSFDEIQRLAETAPKPVFWFRVLGDLDGFM